MRIRFFLFFHDGSVPKERGVAAALGAGVVKMNVDTGVQWAHREGIKNFHEAKENCLQGLKP